MSQKHVVVVGAGIVGAATALWLRRAGCAVTLIDRGAPGQGASFGNACLLASCAVVPVTVPGLLLKAPRYLLDPEIPLFMQWRELPRLAPWLMRFMSNATDRKTRRISSALNGLIGDSVAQHRALALGTAAERWIRESEWNFVYRDRAGYEADAYEWGLRREAGFHHEVIEGAAVREKEPILGPQMGLMVVNRDHGFILDPGAYVQDLVAALEAEGGLFRQSGAQDFHMEGGRVVAVDTDQGRIACDHAVLAAGIWSKGLMRRLGLKVPLETERGYHILYREPSQMPHAPMMLAAGKFVATPMAQGLRCAGIVELGGTDARKSAAPLAFLRRTVSECLPQMQASAQEEWLGFRPTTPDSLPLIGQLRESGIYAAFGHQHIGLTGGAKTGRLIADMISGRHANADLSPFDPMRYRL